MHGKAEKGKFVAAMVIFGTIGLLVKHIGLPSSVIALCRGVIGTLFLLVLMRVRGARFHGGAIGKNLPYLLLSGGALGFNWILLFESYRYTSVAVSTLCYYLAPILVILLFPVVTHEPLTLKKGLCVTAALGGMVGLSGVLQGGAFRSGQGTGILLGLAAAMLYAAIVLLNKRIRDLPALEKTILQLGISAMVLLPYCLVTVRFSGLILSARPAVLLLVAGVVHTGLAYALYFDALGAIPSQTAAIFSYIDPVVAVLTSALLLREPMPPSVGLSAVLILGAAVVSEVQLPVKGRK